MTERSPLLATLALVGCALVAAVAVTWTWSKTSGQIAVSERNFRLRALNQIVSRDRYDNDLFDDTIDIRDPELLGSNEPVTVYRARRNGAPVAAILPIVAPRGYSAAIHLLVGINADGTVAGVRVSRHRETAGLGDNIEIEKSDWILHFDHTALGNPPVESWAVQKDGGQFDQFTGATVTPRAIVKAVRDALLYFDANRDLLFSGTTNDISGTNQKDDQQASFVNP